MIEKPKKERKFLKILGKVGEILMQELLLKLGKSLVQKIGGKKTLPSIIFLALFCNIAFASIDSIPYPITGNKQRLGWQTTGNGLVWRGRSQDTITKPTNYVDKNVKAYLILDSVRGTIFVWRQTYWDSLLVGGGGGGSFTQPVDSLFFDTSVPTNNVDTAKMRWDSDLGTVVLGMYDQVPNELGFKSFWLVKNQTGSTITKGSIVYANGTVGASGRITVAKFIANGSIDAKYLLGITAHDLTDGEDGYVISFGKIRQVNTDTFAAGSILYPSPTVAGVWTDVEPVAPNIDMPIGFCINSSVSNGTIAIRVASGYKLSELHDVSISSPVDKASLYYKSSEGLWRDTTAALLVSDTATMLLPYFRDADTTSLNLTSRFAAKLNTSDTASMLTNYLRTGTAASTYLTQANAASTYLPLTGGTLTGTVNGTNVSLNSNLTISDVIPANPPSIFTTVNTGPSTTATVKFGLNQSNNSAGANMFMGGTQLGGGNGTNPNIYFTDTRRAYASIGGIYTGAGITSSGHIVFNTTPNDNTTALTERMRIGEDGAITMGGTLGVTGFSTFSTGAVINENSNDSDTRIESDGNANMIFVDASTDRVGIGTSTPSKTLDVNGELKIATTTATPTSLLGKDGSNVVGEVTTVTQTGLMKAGGTTANTSSVGIITVAHGLSYTPSQVIATVAQQNSYVIVCHAKDGTNMSFTVYDSVTGNALNNVSVGFFWLAIK